MPNNIKTAVYCLMLLALFSGNACGDALVLNTNDSYPRSTNDENGFEDLIVKEMFRRIGQQVKIVHIPSERALANANDGGHQTFAAATGKTGYAPLPEQASCRPGSKTDHSPAGDEAGWHLATDHPVCSR